MSGTEENSTELVLKEHDDIFHLFDAEDEKQIIMEAQDRMKDALVYTTTQGGKEQDQLSYAGIQHITIMMAQRKETVGALELVEDPIVKMLSHDVKIGDETKTIQKWYANCRVRNTLTGLTTPGFAEADVVIKVPARDPDTNKKIWLQEKKAYKMVDGYDDFGRNKAISKAFRNACKVQIPQKLILEMIKIAKQKGQTRAFDNVKAETVKETKESKPVNSSEWCSCPDEKVDLVENTTSRGTEYGCRRCQRKVDDATAGRVKRLAEQAATH